MTEPLLTRDEWDAVAETLERLRDIASVAFERTGSEEAAAAESRLESVIDSIRRGEPFGFTGKGVDALHAMLDRAREYMRGRPIIEERFEDLQIARAEAERIERLLPPQVTDSCGNVFADLGLPDADRLLEESEQRRRERLP